MYEWKEKEIDQLEDHYSRSAHCSCSRVCFTSTATVGTTIFDTNRSGMDPGVFHHRMFPGQKIRIISIIEGGCGYAGGLTARIPAVLQPFEMLQK
jgi:hypothetical protein